MERRQLNLAEILNRKHLAGGPAGDLDRIALNGEIEPTDTLVVLDFFGVDILTPSYSKKCLVPLWVEREVAIGVRGIERIREDLLACLQLNSLATWELGSAQPQILGDLDASAAETVKYCLELDCVTAASLSQKVSGVRSTAWSNRLAGLFEKRLLNKQQRGRRLEYCLPWTLEMRNSHGS